MFPEARLDVALTVQSGVVAQVKVHSTRLVQASRLFAGRRPHEVTQLLPTIFALCGTAQVLAGLGAMEQAAGQPASPSQRRARQVMLQAETLGEHGLGIARDWPSLVGAAPDLPTARRIKTAMVTVRTALYPDGDWHHPGGGALAPQLDRITAAIAEVRSALTGLLGADPESILADPAGFQSWVNTARTPAVRLLAQLRHPHMAGFGGGPFLPMPDQGPGDLDAQMAADHGGTYLAQPHSGGRVYETGPLARMAWHPVVAEFLAEFGPGPLTRLTARLAEVVSCLQEMTELLQDLDSAHKPAAALVDGTGLGLVEAARGLLAHRVELEGGQVKRYQILAPTEWNFHPKGPLVRGLTGAADQDLERRAILLVHALDPCVACNVTVDHA
jgi:uptake hydrogenase large subunit